MTALSEAAGLRSFAAVDTEPDAAALIAALDEQAGLSAVQRLRAAAFELLDVQLGQHIVDVGCGTGDVTRAIAAIVGWNGLAVGIEASSLMLAEANRRAGTSSLPARFRSGDVTRLEEADGSFDGAYCERVLQHIPHPERAIVELARVTRPGGRVVVIDTDWGMHAVHGADPTLTARILDAWRDNAANGQSGRRLPALFADAGMPRATVVSETMTSVDPHRPMHPPFTTMAAFAERSEAIAAGDGDRWLTELAESGRRGRFFWALTMFAVGGRRP